MHLGIHAGSQRLLHLVLCPISLGVACVCIMHVAMMVCMVCECWTNRQRVSAAAGAAAIAVYKRNFLAVHHQMTCILISAEQRRWCSG
jgi:hypothetical protein